MKNIVDRFWNYVDKKEVDDCWEWKGPITGAGYGHMWAGSKEQGKDISAHRFSYEIHNGDIPNDKWVLHTCDNRKCVNPNHLYVGSPGQNQCDRISRNPIRGGRISSISIEDIENIKKLNSSGISMRKIASLYNKSAAYICMLINNERGENAY